MRPAHQALAAVASFGLGVGLAELFGASSLGVAFAFGQIAFAIGCVILLLRA
jgi:hypothetical protein